MNLKPERKDEADINLTPLIDVVFLLLIFFMVSTTFQRESELNITLPQASEEYTEQKIEMVEISISPQERIFVNGQPLVNSQLSTIREALQNAVEGLEDPPVVISADAQATHQTVIRVMDAARRIGLVRITFATEALTDEDLE